MTPRNYLNLLSLTDGGHVVFFLRWCSSSLWAVCSSWIISTRLNATIAPSKQKTHKGGNRPTDKYLKI